MHNNVNGIITNVIGFVHAKSCSQTIVTFSLQAQQPFTNAQIALVCGEEYVERSPQLVHFKVAPFAVSA